MDLLPSPLMPVLFTVFVWWFGTGVVFLLNQLSPQTFGWSMFGASAVLGMGFLGLLATVGDAGVGGAYHGFLCAILIWAWAEMGFLTGTVMGTSKEPLPAGAQGWPRLRAAIAAILHHEVALIVLGLLVLAASWNQPNQTALWTFGVLYTARLSTKLNLYFGVRNLGNAMLPPHLAHLPSYFRQRRMNAFFPFSLAASVALAWWLVGLALANQSTSFEAASYSMVATLAVLGVVEHLFLVLPFRPETLWTWVRQKPPVNAAKAMEAP